MRIALLYMSRQVARGASYTFDYRRRRSTHLPLTGTWAAEILRELASRGHWTTHVRFETRDFVATDQVERIFTSRGRPGSRNGKEAKPSNREV